MPRPPVLVLALVLACVTLAVASRRLTDAASAGGGLRTDDGDTVHITPELRGGGLTFSPDVTPKDRAWVLEAIASARPEAQRLVHEVDGMVTVETAPALGVPLAMGITRPEKDGFRVWLNVNRLDGTREVDRNQTVLHELGHVIDFALVPGALGARLDAQIPRGGPCGAAVDCDRPEERFADTFAKWALHGAVSAAGAGYGIPAPASIESWGAPLGRLAVSLPA